MGHYGKNVVIVLALVGLGFFAAWLRFRPYLGFEAGYTDGDRSYDREVDDALRFVVWDHAQRLPAPIATDQAESQPALSEDGRFLVFASGSEGARDLFLAEIVDGKPGAPEPLTRLNSSQDDCAPAIANGKLWFASSRAGGQGGLDLWSCDFRGGDPGEPAPLPKGLNTPADETDPAPLPDGARVLFASNAPHGGRRGFDLYLATPIDAGAAAPTYEIHEIEQLDSDADEREPAFSSDGRTLLFASDRAGGSGGFDLYRSVRERGTFLAPQPLLGVNTAAAERSPRIADDGFALWFSRAGPDGNADVFAARSLEIFRRPGHRVGWLELMVLLGLAATALLAWLAKRWETVDVIYKCFLVALTIHLLLLWWFQRVPIEGSEPGLGKHGDGLFAVQLASAKSRADGLKERGGSVSAARSAAAAGAQGPALADVAMGAGDPMPAALPSASLHRASRDASSDAAPGRAGDAARAPARAPVPEPKALALADGEAGFEKHGGGAPSLALPKARSGEAHDDRVDPGMHPDRGAAGTAIADVAGAGAAGPEPGRGEVAALRNDASGEAAPGFTSAPVERSVASGGGGSAIEVVDGERFEKVATGDATSGGGAAALALAPSVGGEAPPARGSDAGPCAASFPGAAGSSDAAGSEAMPGRAAISVAAAEGSGASAPGPQALDLAPTAGSAEGGAPKVDVAFDAPSVGQHGDAAAASQPALPADFLSLEPAGGGATARPERGVADAGGPQRMSFANAASATGAADAPLPPPVAVIDRSGDAPEGDGAIAQRFEHTPYKTRFGLEKELALQLHGGGAETEKAVALGLRYLASRQNVEGYWGDQSDFDDKYGYVCVGKSALCLLAFLGAGHTPASNTEYSEVTARAVKFLVEVQIPDNGHFGWTSAYSHGIATYALAETYALTKDESLRAPIEAAVRHTLGNQSRERDVRNGGGWGYFNPDGPHYDSWSRVSISAWQVMALESARLSGIAVPDAAFDGARRFIENAYDDQHGYFRYNHDPSRLNSDYRTLPASTPAALFALSLLGADVTQKQFDGPRRFVLARSPKEYRWRGEQAFVEKGTGNLYFWYYGTLAMFRTGGDAWDQWNARMKQTLLPSQEKDGSWEPIDSYADKAHDTQESRCYTTAMCVLSLEVYYRYFTPLLRVR